MSLFEAFMLLCFASAWPFSIYKSYTSRSNKGKSLWFLLILLAGYISGITHKVIYNLDYILILYIFNFTLVLIDTALYLRNYLLKKKEA